MLRNFYDNTVVWLMPAKRLIRYGAVAAQNKNKKKTYQHIRHVRANRISGALKPAFHNQEITKKFIKDQNRTTGQRVEFRKPKLSPIRKLSLMPQE